MTIYWFIVLPVESTIADVPMWEKMCWGSHQILTKMNQATHLPISIVSHIKNYENENIFLEKY